LIYFGGQLHYFIALVRRNRIALIRLAQLNGNQLNAGIGSIED